MGQYWVCVDLDKREFINGHDLGSGIKIWEQFANHPVGGSLVLLLTAMPERRGGGDFALDTNGSDPEYDKVVKDVVGRWIGDTIAFVGDYGEVGDLPHDKSIDAGYIYKCCTAGKYANYPWDLTNLKEEYGVNRPEDVYTNISDMVKIVYEYEMEN